MNMNDRLLLRVIMILGGILIIIAVVAAGSGEF
jgi:hypothetical protein